MATKHSGIRAMAVTPAIWKAIEDGVSKKDFSGWKTAKRSRADRYIRVGNFCVSHAYNEKDGHLFYAFMMGEPFIISVDSVGTDEATGYKILGKRSPTGNSLRDDLIYFAVTDGDGYVLSEELNV